MGVYLYRKSLGNSGLELKMGVLEFPLKLQVPNTNVLFRFYVSDCLHLHPLRFLEKRLSQGVVIKAFSVACSQELPIRKRESCDWT